MAISREFITTTADLRQIRVPRRLLRSKDVAGQQRAMESIRKFGQQRPLIVDPDYRLLADVASYRAMKALGFYGVEVVWLHMPSPAAIASVTKLLDCCATLRREVTKFNAILTSLSGMCSELEAYGLDIDTEVVGVEATGQCLIRVLPDPSTDVAAAPSCA